MPTIGTTELIIIMLIVLALFGAGKLPEVGKGLGKGIKEFRNSIRDESAPASRADDRTTG